MLWQTLSLVWRPQTGCLLRPYMCNIVTTVFLVDPNYSFAKKTSGLHCRHILLYTYRCFHWVEAHFGQKAFGSGNCLLDGTWGDCLWQPTGHGLRFEGRYLVTGCHSHWDYRRVPSILWWTPIEGPHKYCPRAPTHSETSWKVVTFSEWLCIQVSISN